MKVRLDIELDQANVINEALVERLRQLRGVAKLSQATPEEKMETQRDILRVETTMRVLRLPVPEAPKGE